MIICWFPLPLPAVCTNLLVRCSKISEGGFVQLFSITCRQGFHEGNFWPQLCNDNSNAWEVVILLSDFPHLTFECKERRSFCFTWRNLRCLYYYRVCLDRFEIFDTNHLVTINLVLLCCHVTLFFFVSWCGTFVAEYFQTRMLISESIETVFASRVVFLLREAESKVFENFRSIVTRQIERNSKKFLKISSSSCYLSFLLNIYTLLCLSAEFC